MIRFLIEKELKQLFRNSFLPRMIVFMPLLMMLVLPWAANQEITDLGLCVIDNDRSTASVRLIGKIPAGGYFRLAGTASNYAEGLRQIESGQADVILEIPKDFEKKVIRGEQPVLSVSANSVNGNKGTIGSAYLAQIAAQAGGVLFDHSPALAGKGQAASLMSLQYRYNPNLDYKIFMVPAMMVMLLTLITGFLPALNIVAEKEAGTIEQINVTPVSKFSFIMSKLLPYWMIGLFVLTLCLFIAYWIYGLYPKGYFATIYVFSGIYILVVSGLGLIISNYSDTIQQAMFVMYFFIMVFLLMSGLLTPVKSMPDWAQWIAAFNPLKYFVEALRAIILKGSVLADLKMKCYALVAFALVLNAGAVLSYRKRN